MRFPRLSPPLSLFLCLCFAVPASASTSVVDMKGTLIHVEAATAITTEGATVSVLKLRQTLKDGKAGEEIVPETADAQADLNPLILFDPESEGIVLIWSRYDGRRMALAATKRDAAGTWSSITYLDSGTAEPIDPQAVLDTSSRLHVVWKVSGKKSGDALRYRGFDLTTLQALGDEADPFATAAAASKRQRAGSTETAKGGKGGEAKAPEPVAPGLTVEAPKPASFSTFGIEVGCDAAVVYRVTGTKLEVSTLADGKWRKGEVDLGAGAEAASARPLVADIARRFCRP